MKHSLFVLLLVSLNSLQAGMDILYVPGMVVPLGGSFDPKEPEYIKQSCFGAGLPSKEFHRQPYIHWSQAYVEDASSLETALGIDLSLYAHYSIKVNRFETTLGFSLNQKRSDKRKRATFVLKAEQNFGYEHLELDQGREPIEWLRPDIQTLVREGDVQGFRKRCGTKFIRSLHKGAKVIGRFEFLGADESNRSKIAATLDLVLEQLKVGKVKLDSEVKTRMKEVLSSFSTRVTIQGFGGGGLRPLASAASVTTLADLEELISVFVNYVSGGEGSSEEGFVQDNAAVIGASLGKWSDFLQISLQEVSTSLRDEKVKKLFFELKRVSRTLEVLEEIASQLAYTTLRFGSEEPTQQLFSPDELITLSEHYRASLVQAARTCKEDEGNDYRYCMVPDRLLNGLDGSKKVVPRLSDLNLAKLLPSRFFRLVQSRSPRDPRH